MEVCVADRFPKAKMMFFYEHRVTNMIPTAVQLLQGIFADINASRGNHSETTFGQRVVKAAIYAATDRSDSNIVPGKITVDSPRSVESVGKRYAF